MLACPLLATLAKLISLKDISLDIPAGQSVAILGPSGAGKTSLLMLISGLETLSAGKAVLAGQDITTMDEDSLAQLRRDNVGIVFQAFRLIPSMTGLAECSRAARASQ
jgi:putative ABC transport system ATP-binding protein